MQHNTTSLLCKVVAGLFEAKGVQLYTETLAGVTVHLVRESPRGRIVAALAPSPADDVRDDEYAFRVWPGHEYNLGTPRTAGRLVHAASINGLADTLLGMD